MKFTSYKQVNKHISLYNDHLIHQCHHFRFQLYQLIIYVLSFDCFSIVFCLTYSITATPSFSPFIPLFLVTIEEVNRENQFHETGFDKSFLQCIESRHLRCRLPINVQILTFTLQVFSWLPTMRTLHNVELKQQKQKQQKLQ